ncbi:MAG: primosomal protein N' [Gammaproteobacteria bacterium]
MPSPVNRLFDYAPPEKVATTSIQPGIRVLVPFGRRQLTGILIETDTSTTIHPQKLRAALEILDHTPVFDQRLLALIKWASRYYHYPLGEACATALPVLLRNPKQQKRNISFWWTLTDTGKSIQPGSLKNASRQATVIARLQVNAEGLSGDALDAPLSVLKTLEQKGWLKKIPPPEMIKQTSAAYHTQQITLNAAQTSAFEQTRNKLDSFYPCLLEGVTGSGKTAVYLALIKEVLKRQQQVLVLVPEIGLTPQLVQRFGEQLDTPLAVMHSGLNKGQRLAAWQQARSGAAGVIIGTRSAVFSALAKPGLIIVDEEHDVSLKQQEGFRYSARDLAVWRAHQYQIPVVLGSATPSLESLHNVQTNRYTLLSLPERAGNASMPDMTLLDVRQSSMQDNLSDTLIAQIQSHLTKGGQVLLFLNRRGFAPVMLCHDCGWSAKCQRCDANMTYHRSSRQLRCHHCDHQQRLPVQCPECGSSELIAIGQGTERIEAALQKCFPQYEVLRIDRDTTSRKGSLKKALKRASSGQAPILLGTQMLAKGHHFPGVTLVAILDVDQGLLSADFRSSERMAQLIIQVAGRSGRGEQQGEVIIQTHQPEHPLLQQLISQGYPAFAKLALQERQLALLPPYTQLAMLRAESPQADEPMNYLLNAKQLATPLLSDGINFWGPVPAPMERRAGRYRAQLLVQSAERACLQKFLRQWLPQIANQKSTRVRWSIDVDPQDTF